MALALEGVDLIALCAILVLMGLLIATRNTFSQLAVVLDVSILGVRPFHSVAVAIENTIIAGCNVGIRALGTVAHDLWAGLLWSVNETVQALMAIPNGVHAALQYLWKHAVPEYVKAALADVHKAVIAVDARVSALAKELGTDVLALEASIKTTAVALAQALRRDISTAIDGVTSDVAADIRKARAEVTHEISIAVGGAESLGNEALTRLRAAEDAAIDAANKAEGATAAELRDFIGQVPLTNIAAALAAIPLLRAAVDTLEAETGLGRAECRAKVKGICGTDPAQWAKLLAGIGLIDIAFNFRELAQAAIEMVKVVEPEIKSFIGE